MVNTPGLQTCGVLGHPGTDGGTEEGLSSYGTLEKLTWGSFGGAIYLSVASICCLVPEARYEILNLIIYVFGEFPVLFCFWRG